MEPRQKPINILIKAQGANVEVVLKGRGIYRGKLVEADSYMNMMLKGAKEYSEEGLVASYGDVFIRGNNVMYVSIEPKTKPPGER